MGYTYKTLEGVPLEVISACLNEAFSDYYVPIHMNPQQFKGFLLFNGVNLQHCYGAFCGEQMVGLLLLSSCEHNGEKTVFDVATGVIPGHRGKGVFTSLFHYSLRRLQENGMRRYMLEVMQQNEKAIALYERLGFQIRRALLVLNAKGNNAQDCPDIQILPYKDFAPTTSGNMVHVQPSFEYFTEILRLNPERCAVAMKDDSYCVYDQTTGHICQIGYSHMQNLEQIIRYLLSHFDRVTLKISMSSTRTLPPCLISWIFRYMPGSLKWKD